MPTYEYHCMECGHVFEHHEHIEEHPTSHPKCPKCQSVKVEQLLSSFFAQTGKKS